MVKVWPVALVAATLVLGAANSAQAVVVFCPVRDQLPIGSFRSIRRLPPRASRQAPGTSMVMGTHSTPWDTRRSTSPTTTRRGFWMEPSRLRGVAVCPERSRSRRPPRVSGRWCLRSNRVKVNWIRIGRHSCFPPVCSAAPGPFRVRNRCRTLICTAATEKFLHLRRRLRNRCPRYCSARDSWLHDCSSAPESAEGP